ncbi:uncharacterized protein LOC113288833 [Papaver somniferum]|uniref:uncharacterized protein LOC113288833 n=1 Tax=Papaver somniferum TaxID=3469 RepID=UPI000E6F65F7|nr:uncharacterized protein LOC113288833 [Papaver somniferum]XP_026393751.1 uncharacterized protein LOC113288833 [Papaver somniferum]
MTMAGIWKLSRWSHVSTMLLVLRGNISTLPYQGTCWRCDKFSSYYKKLKMVLKVARKKMRRLMRFFFFICDALQVDKLIKEEAHEMDVKEVQWSSQVHHYEVGISSSSLSEFIILLFNQ